MFFLFSLFCSSSHFLTGVDHPLSNLGARPWTSRRSTPLIRAQLSPSPSSFSLSLLIFLLISSHLTFHPAQTSAFRSNQSPESVRHLRTPQGLENRECPRQKGRKRGILDLSPVSKRGREKGRTFATCDKTPLAQDGVREGVERLGLHWLGLFCPFRTTSLIHFNFHILWLHE